MWWKLIEHIILSIQYFSRDIHGSFRGRWLRIHHRIFKIQDGGSSMADENPKSLGIRWKSVYWGFWGRWLRIHYQIFKIEDGGPNMADENPKNLGIEWKSVYWGFWGRWLRIHHQIFQIRGYESNFHIFFLLKYDPTLSVNPETTTWTWWNSVSFGVLDYYEFPWRILHLEFRKSNDGFVISGLKNPSTPIFIWFRDFSDFRPPYWIRHLEFWKSDDGIVISDLEHSHVCLLKNIERIKLYVLSIFSTFSSSQVIFVNIW